MDRTGKRAAQAQLARKTGPKFRPTMLPHPYREVLAERGRGDRPGSRGASPGYSCATAPDLHRLRHYALASGPEGTPTALSVCWRRIYQGEAGRQQDFWPRLNLDLATNGEVGWEWGRLAAVDRFS